MAFSMGFCIVATDPNGGQIDLMHWIGRTALELIAQSGLGCSIDSLSEDTDIHPYSTAVKSMTYVPLEC